MDTNHLRELITQRIDDKRVNCDIVEREAGIGRLALRNFLRGKTKQPKIDIIFAAAKFLDITPYEMFNQEDIKNFNIKNGILAEEIEEIEEVKTKLILNCVKQITKSLEKSSKVLTYKKFCEFVKKVYIYSEKYSNSEADIPFIEWTIDNIN